MRPYGMTRYEYHDDDARGTAATGRASHLRGSRHTDGKRSMRRVIKRRARAFAKRECNPDFA